MTKYRVNRDWFYAKLWSVERKSWWRGWVEERGMLATKEEALELIELLKVGDAD